MRKKKKPGKNILGKGENDGNQHFLNFPQYFLPYDRRMKYFFETRILSSLNALNLDEATMLSLIVKG